MTDKPDTFAGVELAAIEAALGCELGYLDLPDIRGELVVVGEKTYQELQRSAMALLKLVPIAREMAEALESFSDFEFKPPKGVNADAWRDKYRKSKEALAAFVALENNTGEDK